MEVVLVPYKDPEKQRQAQHESYLRNKEEIVKASRKTKESQRRFVQAIKSFPCMDCGESWPACAMQLDHLDPEDKFKKVSSLIGRYSWETLIKEIMKCDLVCACCHAIRTEERKK